MMMMMMMMMMHNDDDGDDDDAELACALQIYYDLQKKRIFPQIPCVDDDDDDDDNSKFNMIYKKKNIS